MSNKDTEGNKIKTAKISKRETSARHRARCVGKGKYCACGHAKRGMNHDEGTHHCNRRIV